MINPSTNDFLTRFADDGCSGYFINMHEELLFPIITEGQHVFDPTSGKTYENKRYIYPELVAKPSRLLNLCFSVIGLGQDPRPLQEKLTNASRLATYIQRAQRPLVNLGLNQGVSLSKLRARVDVLYGKFLKNAEAEDRRVAGAANPPVFGPINGFERRISMEKGKALAAIDTAQQTVVERTPPLWKRALSLSGRVGYATVSQSLSLLGRVAYFGSVEHPNLGLGAAAVATVAYIIMA
ncbi:MAG: hypothetical protein KR126chlam1_00935 [Chlamydiae bacterium]|nr:hypothetical protein [Chlamydiota bacterium]